MFDVLRVVLTLALISFRMVFLQARDRQAQLVQKLSCVMIRRTKQIISHQLPTKTDNIVFCEMSIMQMRAYKRVLSSPDVQLLVSPPPKACAKGALFEEDT